MTAQPAAETAAVAWHDCECGAYSADLGLWRRLAGASPGPVLDLGAGTGRVALALARTGIPVTAVERDRGLSDELSRRARAAGVGVEVVAADVRELALGERFALILAPMQLPQMLGGAGDRAALLRMVAAHLSPGGRFAAALLANEPSSARGPALPDVLERDGWVYSSLPLEAVRDGDALELRRLRQAVSPSGELVEELDSTRLDLVSAERFESEALAAGLHPAGRFEVETTAEHVGSVIVVLEGAS